MNPWLRRALFALLLAGVVVLLFTVVFPAVTDVLQNPTLG